MSKQLWILSDDLKGSKNIVIFALKSMGRSDLLSTGAGSSRANQRQQQIKNPSINVLVGGQDTCKVVPSKGGAANTNQRKKAQKPKAAKPAKAGKAVTSNAQRLRKPSGFPRPSWDKASNSEKLKIIEEFRAPKAPLPNRGGLGRRKVPNNTGENKGYVNNAFDFGWGEHFPNRVIVGDVNDEKDWQ